MKIAITGCNGQLGTDLVGLLQDSGHALCAVDLPDIDITSDPSVQAALREFAP